jgi:hypothetical protein
MARMLSACLLALGLVAFLPAHEEDREGPVCDRFSLCFICGDGATCLLPGLPLPEFPGLPLPNLPALG